jgi:tetratricopeptide (TPR) repeat protein
MIRLRILTIALALLLGAPLALLLAAPVAQAAEQANKITTKAVAEPIKKAQQAMSKKQWDAALAEIKKAQAITSKTPFEAHQIDEFLGYVLLQQKKFREAAPVFERTLNSGFLPADRVDDRTKTVAQLYSTLGEHRKAVEWSRKWLDKHPGDIDMRVLLGQSYYLLNDFKNAVTTMTAVVTQAERAGQTPKEDWLKVILTSQFRLNNPEGRAEALKKMVRHHPNAEYWANLLDLYRRRDLSDRITLGYYRLMDEVGVLEDKDDYVEMAQLAMDADVPGEAQRIVEKGFRNGTLKSSNATEQGRYDRLLAAAKERAAVDRASLTQLAKQAEKATQGQIDVALGQTYLSYGNYDTAVAALQRGLKKGGVTDADESRIGLGIAYLRQGQTKLAVDAFKAVPTDSKWRDLAALWELRAQGANDDARVTAE